MKTLKLRKFLQRSNTALGNDASNASITAVIRGAKHLRKHGFNILETVLSPEFINGHSIARVIIGGYEMDQMSGQAVREHLHIKHNQHEADMGLDWQEKDEVLVGRIRFLWIYTALFIRENP